VIIRSTLRRRSPKSLPLNPFADPHPLTPVPSILYNKHGGRGTKPLRPSDVRSSHPKGGHGTQFASQMNLSPLECAVAAKQPVLRAFCRNRPESALLSLLASVDSKWFTARLTRLESALTKNTRGVGPLNGLSFRSVPRAHIGNPAGHGTGGTGDAVCPSCPIRPIAEQALWCNNPQRYEISDDPRKQLRSPRCLRIVSGHRELSTDVPGRKSLVLTSALARRPRSSVLV